MAPRKFTKVSTADLRVEVFATSVGVHPVESLQMFVNDQKQGPIRRVQVPKLGGFEDDLKAILSPGENTIKVWAKAGGSFDYSEEVRIRYLTEEKKRSRLHILTIGLDKYQFNDTRAGGFRQLNEAAS